MPYVLRVGGQCIVLEDSDAERTLAELVRLTRLRMWGGSGGPHSYFQTYYRYWQHHNRYHNINIFLWTVEALGGATLPTAARVNRLRNQNRALNA